MVSKIQSAQQMQNRKLRYAYSSTCSGSSHALQIDQTSSLLLTLTRLLSSKGIVICLPKWTSSKSIDACWSCLRWCHTIWLLLSSVSSLHLRTTGELLTEEWVAPCLGCMQFVETLPRAIDKCTWRRVLGWNPHLTRVTKGIHTLTRTQQSVETFVLWVCWFVWRGRLLRCLIAGDRIKGGLVVEIRRSSLLCKRAQRWRASLLLLHLWTCRREWVV